MDPLEDFTQCVHRARAGVLTWESLPQFLESLPGAEDGVHTIGMGDGPHLDVLLLGSPLSGHHGAVPVFFSASVRSRHQKHPPFFSGISVVGRIRAPLIAISDPSTQLSESLGLAWYAGGGGTDVQDAVHRLLSAVTAASGNHLWLVGGSGGGFAALEAGFALGESASVLVFNPQTNLLEFSAGSVKRYLGIAHGMGAEMLDRPDWKQRAGQRLTDAGLRWDLCDRGPERLPRQLIYLQNWNDWDHVDRHMAPFVRTHLSHQGPGTDSWSDDDHGVVQLDLGQGHAAPRPEAVQLLLRTALTGGHSAREILEWGVAAGTLRRVEHPGAARDLRSMQDEVLRSVTLEVSAQNEVLPSVSGRPSDLGNMRFRLSPADGTPTGPGALHELTAPAPLPDGLVRSDCRATLLDGFGHELGDVELVARHP